MARVPRAARRASCRVCGSRTQRRGLQDDSWLGHLKQLKWWSKSFLFLFLPAILGGICSWHWQFLVVARRVLLLFLRTHSAREFPLDSQCKKRATSAQILVLLAPSVRLVSWWSVNRQFCPLDHVISSYAQVTTNERAPLPPAWPGIVLAAGGGGRQRALTAGVVAARARGRRRCRFPRCACVLCDCLRIARRERFAIARVDESREQDSSLRVRIEAASSSSLFRGVGVGIAPGGVSPPRGCLVPDRSSDGARPQLFRRARPLTAAPPPRRGGHHHRARPTTTTNI